MTRYRTVQQIRDSMEGTQRALRDSLLADSTEAMGRRASEAMALVDAMLQALRSGLDVGGGDSQDHSTDNLLKAAERALTLAWDKAEKVGLGTSVADMRARALDFKTYVDFADAYVSAALGTEL